MSLAPTEQNIDTFYQLAVMEKCCTVKVLFGVLITIGVILVVLGSFSPKLFQSIVEQQLVLIKGNEAYNNWYRPPIPIFMQFYVFNYTNVNGILSNHTKPSVTQLGPYTYREVRVNEVIDYNEFNITYLQNYTYVFDRSMSCNICEEGDIIVSPSIVTMTLLQAIHDNVNSTTHPYIADVVDAFLNGVPEFSLFHKLTVKQLIWGYEDKILRIVKDLEDILKTIGFTFPPLDTRVALQQNGTAFAELTGNITMLTGKEDIKDVQRVIQWRGLDDIPYWLTKYGRMINGTDGTHASPFLSRNHKLYMFSPDLCRSLYAVYKNDDIFKGIEVYRFGTTAELFINSSVNHDNAAFCSKKKCWPSGLLPVAACRGGPPIFMSSPHFYQGDPMLVKAVDGMHPNASLHSTHIDIEPTTGIAIRAEKRLQVNVMAQKSFLSKSAPLQDEYNFLPVMFACESAFFDDKTAKMLRDKVLFPKTVFMYVKFILIGTGSALLLCSLVLAGIWIYNRRANLYGVFNEDRLATFPT